MESPAATVAVLVPVLNRPGNVRPLLESLRASCGADEATALFVATEEDADEIAALSEAGTRFEVVPFEPWAEKINHGFRIAAAEGFDWMLLGADDLHFHSGWVDAFLAVYAETGACVIGTNDLANPRVKRGDHSTHPLVHRDYLECGTIDEDGKVVTEAYQHMWVDDELVGTAKARGEWAFAADAIVEHLHPHWGKAKTDATYEKGLRTAAADWALFRRRRRMWGAR